MLTTNFRQQYTDIGVACAHAQGIFDPVHGPMLVLDKALLAASRSFYSAFNVRPEETQGQHLYTLGDGQWTFRSFEHCGKDHTGARGD